MLFELEPLNERNSIFILFQTAHPSFVRSNNFQGIKVALSNNFPTITQAFSRVIIGHFFARNVIKIVILAQVMQL